MQRASSKGKQQRKTYLSEAKLNNNEMVVNEYKHLDANDKKRVNDRFTMLIRSKGVKKY